VEKTNIVIVPQRWMRMTIHQRQGPSPRLTKEKVEPEVPPHLLRLDLPHLHQRKRGRLSQRRKKNLCSLDPLLEGPNVYLNPDLTSPAYTVNRPDPRSIK
jgi:hypothetical protein